MRAMAPSALRIRTTGCRPDSGVRPCWRIVSVTCHGRPGAVPSGSELRPTVAKPPALAVPGTARATRTAAAIAHRVARMPGLHRPGGGGSLRADFDAPPGADPQRPAAGEQLAQLQPDAAA